VNSVRLSQSRVLISNDDGIHAPGLKVLERAAREIFKEVWVVAPETEQSGASHSLTLRRPLRIRQVEARRYAVDGTPTDSVLLGIQKVMRAAPPDVVLSGINCGGNLGEDITYSGTVAAAIEGCLLGLPSVALSQYYTDRQNISWDVAETWTPRVLEILFDLDWPPGVIMNVNYPNVSCDMVSGIEAAGQGRRKIGGALTEGQDPRGDQYYWVGPQRAEDLFEAGTDLKAVTNGSIAITPLSLDLTHQSMLRNMKLAFG